MDISFHRKTVSESICLFTLVIDHEFETCAKTFARIRGLMQHKQIHTEDEPYRCDACGKTFAR